MLGFVLGGWVLFSGGEVDRRVETPEPVPSPEGLESSESPESDESLPSAESLQADERSESGELPNSSSEPETTPRCPEPGSESESAGSEPESFDPGEEDPLSGRGLMAAGLSLLGGSYLNMVTGGLVLEERRVGRRMMIPMVGPFIAAASVDPPLQKIMLSVAGVAQFAGLAKLIAGAVLYARWVSDEPNAVSVLPMPTLAGGGAALHVRF